MSYKILIINPGSTSTKIGVYEDETQLMEETLRHTTEEIAQYDTIYDQKDFRKNVILDVLKEKDVDLNSIDVVVDVAVYLNQFQVVLMLLLLSYWKILRLVSKDSTLLT